MLISITRDQLTIPQIAARLGIDDEGVVKAAIRKVYTKAAPTPIEADDGSTQLVYGGSLLLAIREQLVGVPLEYIARRHGLMKNIEGEVVVDTAKVDRVTYYLSRQGYNIVGDRISPRAAKEVSKRISFIMGTEFGGQAP